MDETSSRRAILLVLDSLGIGAAADADRFGDVGADTLGHVLDAWRQQTRSELSIPWLTRLGLRHAHAESTGRPVPEAEGSMIGAWGHAAELSSGKDTPSGHWEMAGVPVLFDWGYFTDRDESFPAALLESLIRRAELPGVLGNCHASGTEIIRRLGREHVETGRPIVYTSADSVFQVAAHQVHFGLERLYRVCEIAREMVDEYQVGRVIARPFVGDEEAGYERTPHRRDYAVPPPSPTLLDRLTEAGGEVISIGKIGDIFAHRGTGREVKADGIDGLWDATLEAVDAVDRDAAGQGHSHSHSHSHSKGSLVFTNFVDFDMRFGHRRDARGYAEALAVFDRRLPELLDRLRPEDLLILTADHGCDPTWPGSDHTREHVPVLACGAGLPAGSLGRRGSFADIGQTLAEYFALDSMKYGESFL